MSSIDLTDFEKRTILSIDRRRLNDRIEEAIARQDSHVLDDLRLSDCGEFVQAKMFEFHSAIQSYEVAKPKDRDYYHRDAWRAGFTLSNAVYRVQWILENDGWDP